MGPVSGLTMSGSSTAQSSSTSVPAIVGPTASGKSSIALHIAERTPGVEIVSADSRQVYRELSIGTAKPTPEELASVPHHCVDLVSVSTRFSAGRFMREARTAVEDILARSGLPLIVGGSGFYVKALFEGLSAPPLQETTFKLLTRRLKEQGRDWLYDQLIEVDPESANLIPKENGERLIRALGCFLETGERYSSFGSPSKTEPGYEPTYITLMPERDTLWERIDRRCGEMIGGGLIQEVENLLQRGFTSMDPGMRTVGYRQVIETIEGRLAPEDLRESIFIETRQYAKRQRTWFNNQVETALRVSSHSDWREIEDTCLATWDA